MNTTMITMLILFSVIVVTVINAPLADARPDAAVYFTLNNTDYDQGNTIQIFGSVFEMLGPDLFVSIHNTGNNSLVYNSTIPANGFSNFDYTIISNQWDEGNYTVKVWQNYNGNVDLYSHTVPFEYHTALFCGEFESFYSVINGTNSSDYIFGTNGIPNLIFGNGGNDIIKSQGINNCIYGGPGNDFILAAKEGNTVYGGPGDDYIKIRAYSAAFGEDGNDIILIGNPIAPYTVDGGPGTADVCVTDYPWRSAIVENCEIISSDVIQ